MAIVWRDLCCGVRYLQAKCFIIGYLNLFAAAVDLGCHLVILSIVTNFFSCDVDLNILRGIDWPWLEPFLVIINIGTHGFYPFPLVLTYYNNLSAPTTRRCYPGMLHIYLIDVINIAIHIIWLRLVVSYIAALHKKDPEPMRMFFSLSVVRVVLQLMYFVYKPYFYSEENLETYCSIKIIDCVVAVIFLCIMNRYIKVLREKKSEHALAPAAADRPPSYIESLMHTQTDTNKPPQIVVATEEKTVG